MDCHTIPKQRYEMTWNNIIRGSYVSANVGGILSLTLAG